MKDGTITLGTDGARYLWADGVPCLIGQAAKVKTKVARVATATASGPHVATATAFVPVVRYFDARLAAKDRLQEAPAEGRSPVLVLRPGPAAAGGVVMGACKVASVLDHLEAARAFVQAHGRK